MVTSRLKRTSLASSILLALGTWTAVPVLAQDDNQNDEVEERESAEAEQIREIGGDDSAQLEDIQVTGYRGSLLRAMDRKRDPVGVVDAITAEDIGKFPDQNLAESLQRITGVSIDRNNNEGSRVTVRGFGPEFNLVTLNGRSMPTAGGRSFDFADLATEGINAVEVYKTAQAGLPTGGIGATVNIMTARPLQVGSQAVVSAKAVHETSSSDSDVGDLDEITPEIAGLYSNTFMDGRLGILIAGSYQERDNREENAAVDNWGPSLQLNGGIINDNNQRADGVWWHPQNIGYGWSDITRERTNGQLALQFAPTDRLTATLDWFYSEVDFEKDSNSVGIWFECPNIEATVNERGTVTQVSQACGDYATNVARDHTIKENDSIGFNLEWVATDDLVFEFDAHSSSSELRGGGINGEPGSSANLIIGNTSCDWCGDVDGAGPFTATIANQTAIFGANGIPTFDVDFRSTGPNGGPQDGLLPSDLGSLFGQAFNTDVYNDIDQYKLGGTWTNDSTESALARVDFGAQFTQQEFDTRNAYSGLLPAGFWLTSAQHWPDDQWQLSDFNGLLSGFSNGGSFPTDFYYTAPFEYLVDQFETVGADNFPCCYWPDAAFWGPDFQDPSGTRGRFWSGPLGNSGLALVDEDITSVYGQAVFQRMIGDMPFDAVIGLRYENVETTSFGQEVPATAIVWVGGNEFSYEFANNPSLRRGEGDQDHFLPSVDLKLEVREDIVTRFSYSRSIARPPIGALSPNRSFIGNPNVRNRRVSSGNPDLEPYESDNLDLAVEWYYAPGSYAALNYFRKRVDNFLVSTTVQQTFDGIFDPYLGVLAEQARAELIAEGISPTDQAVFERINIIRGADPTAPISGQPGDPLAVFDVTTTTNAEVGNVYGWEVALQHMFGDTGFGLQANATFVNGDVDADRDVVNQSFALPGLSDSANLAVFYENEAISARVAYNWRDEFLAGFDQFGAPVFTEEYKPVDLNVTWYVNNELSVFFEALNVTEEVQRTYVRYPEQFLRGNEYGARFNLGARFRF